ncbi:hypothetical protein [Verrucosispora sp. NA02020]|uniref:hypothetical protein n=1 Tax=Verrucosispora sp. NA02020 TaxID=2742132 RepID=UPI001591D042|nr:hypothetical protein [Verrucosispora sp. NA02020]QKW15354.1 hypothetical protein HUT12_23050 [Verrucosispora sp. NA02020]
MTDTTTPTDPLRDHLHHMIAAVAQREYEDSITTPGAVAHAAHLGSRIAAEVLSLFDTDMDEQWEVRGTDPDFASDRWTSYPANRGDAARIVRQARTKPGCSADAFRVLELRTIGEKIEVTP